MRPCSTSELADQLEGQICGIAPPVWPGGAERAVRQVARWRRLAKAGSWLYREASSGSP